MSNTDKLYATEVPLTEEQSKRAFVKTGLTPLDVSDKETLDGVGCFSRWMPWQHEATRYSDDYRLYTTRRKAPRRGWEWRAILFTPDYQTISVLTRLPPMREDAFEPAFQLTEVGTNNRKLRKDARKPDPFRIRR
mgnify:CR=1 FL=1